MTNSEKDVITIRRWCGSDFPVCFDVTIEDEETPFECGLLDTEIAGGKENERPESYAVAENWDELLDMCKRGAINRHGFRITAVHNYQASHQIVYNPKK